MRWGRAGFRSLFNGNDDLFIYACLTYSQRALRFLLIALDLDFTNNYSNTPKHQIFIIRRRNGRVLSPSWALAASSHNSALNASVQTATHIHSFCILQNRLVTLAEPTLNKMRFTLVRTLLVAAGFSGFVFNGVIAELVKGVRSEGNEETKEDTEFWERFLGNYKKQQKPALSLSPPPTP